MTADTVDTATINLIANGRGHDAHRDDRRCRRLWMATADAVNTASAATACPSSLSTRRIQGNTDQRQCPMESLLSPPCLVSLGEVI
jgi:hypothetical protein